MVEAIKMANQEAARLGQVGHEDGPGLSPEIKDANLDWDSITAVLQQAEQGKIVEVEDEVDHKTVEVWTE